MVYTFEYMQCTTTQAYGYSQHAEGVREMRLNVTTPLCSCSLGFHTSLVAGTVSLGSQVREKSQHGPVSPLWGSNIIIQNPNLLLRRKFETGVCYLCPQKFLCLLTEVTRSKEVFLSLIFKLVHSIDLVLFHISTGH